MRTRTTLFAFGDSVATLIDVYIAIDIFGQYFSTLTRSPGQMCLFICPKEIEKTLTTLKWFFFSFLGRRSSACDTKGDRSRTRSRQFIRMKSNKFEWNVITIFIQRRNGPLNRRHEYIWECARARAAQCDLYWYGEDGASPLIQRKIVLVPLSGIR